MIQVIVRNLKGEIKFDHRFLTLDEANAWISQCEHLKMFGKPERWVHGEDLSHRGEDKADAIASAEIGGPDEDAKKYKFPSEYSIEIKDITTLVSQQKINDEALAYLCKTDWMVLRYIETGKPLSEEVSLKRRAARAAIVVA